MDWDASVVRIPGESLLAETGRRTGGRDYTSVVQSGAGSLAGVSSWTFHEDFQPRTSAGRQQILGVRDFLVVPVLYDMHWNLLEHFIAH